MAGFVVYSMWPFTMDQFPIFCFALRPFSLGVSGLIVLVGRLANGDYESFSLCSRKEGQSDATRLEFTKALDLETVLHAAQFEAQELMPSTYLPVSWIQTTDTATRSVELSEVFGAVAIALQSVKSPQLLDVLARVVAPKPAL